MGNEGVKFQVQKAVGADCIGGERYWEDVRRSRMNGADPERAQKMAFKAWEGRRGNLGNLVPQHRTAQG